VISPLFDFFREENKTQGYATYKVLGAITPSESSSVGNQLGSTRYDPNKPQSVEMSWGTKRLPTDFYKWEVEVTIDSTVDCFDQPAVLKHCYLTYSHGKQRFLQQDEYSVSLDQLIRILPLLRKKSTREAVLLTLNSSDCTEYVVDAEEVPAD